MLTFRRNVLLLSSELALRSEDRGSRFILIAGTHIPKYTAPHCDTTASRTLNLEDMYF